MSLSRTFLGTAALCGFVFVTGCASNAERPTQQLTEARTLIEHAERDGAPQLAAAEIERARSKLLAAESAAEDGEEEEARRLAEQAIADARYAAARTSAAKTRQSAQAVEESLEALREEAARAPE